MMAGAGFVCLLKDPPTNLVSPAVTRLDLDRCGYSSRRADQPRIVDHPGQRRPARGFKILLKKRDIYEMALLIKRGRLYRRLDGHNRAPGHSLAG